MESVVATAKCVAASSLRSGSVITLVIRCMVGGASALRMWVDFTPMWTLPADAQEQVRC